MAPAQLVEDTAGIVEAATVHSLVAAVSVDSGRRPGSHMHQLVWPEVGFAQQPAVDCRSLVVELAVAVQSYRTGTYTR